MKKAINNGNTFLEILLLSCEIFVMILEQKEAGDVRVRGVHVIMMVPAVVYEFTMYIDERKA